jgi:uncharacterized protein YhbP (UPF0306 family)
MTTPTQRAASIISANRYLTLATAVNDKVWASPIAYVVQLKQDRLTLVYYSAVRAIHSENLTANSRCSGAIFDSTASSDEADGVQFAAHVETVGSEELPGVMAHYFLKSFPDALVRKRWERVVFDFLAEAPQRFYRIVIDEVWVPDTNVTQIDLRVSVDVGDLLLLLRNSA